MRRAPADRIVRPPVGVPQRGRFMKKLYTSRQGQFLAFIQYYLKINGQPPAKADMQLYFRISAPSVHQMIVTLEERRLIEREPRKARSIRLLLTRDELPDLE